MRTACQLNKEKTFERVGVPIPHLARLAGVVE